MKWFGINWGASICHSCEHEPTPVGTICGGCGEAIEKSDNGVSMPVDTVMHLECFLRSVLGSVGHQKKTCSCYGGNEEDPPGMTLREAAKAAVELWCACVQSHRHFRRQSKASRTLGVEIIPQFRELSLQTPYSLYENADCIHYRNLWDEPDILRSFGRARR